MRFFSSRSGGRAKQVVGTAILVSTYWGQAPPDEVERLTRAGLLPRNSAIEVARAIGAEVIDSNYMAERAHPVGRAVARRFGLPVGQVVEAVLRGRKYRRVLAWADRLGLPLAMLNKLTRSSQDLVMISVDLSAPKKALFLKRFQAYTHMRAIVQSSSVQAHLASSELAVPKDKLHLLPPGVDVDFWRLQEPAEDRVVCAVGWEARDYGTLVRSVAGLDARIEVALGTIVFPSPSATEDVGGEEPDGSMVVARPGLSAFQASRGTAGYRMFEEWLQSLGTEELPGNIAWYQQLEAPLLREVYARSRFVVIPLRDVPFDAGYTAVLEALAMGRAVIVTRTRGQIDLIEDGKQGLYVPLGDATALRAAIERLLDDPDEAIRMGRAGRRLVEERYTVDGYVKQLTRLMLGGVGATDTDPTYSRNRGAASRVASRPLNADGGSEPTT